MVDIIGFPNYTINEKGEIYSKVKKIIMKQSIDKYGYFQIGLRNGGENQKRFLIHRLVYQAFNLKSGEIMPLTVDHKNRDETDNSLDNLRAATYSENNRNKGKQINNKLGHKNIRITQEETFRVSIRTEKQYSKTFKTLSEAIAHRDIKLLELHGEFANNGEL